MRKIFINYRRAEAEYAAGALGRDLRRYFGEEKVFRDKEDIGGGAAWKQRVLDEIDRQSALLVLIGRDWANIPDAQGRRRLDNPNDPLRLEIADALHDGAAIIPILLENAEMPSESELPEELRPVAEHNAIRLRDSDWAYDFSNICRTLERAGFEPIAPPTGHATATASPAKKGVSAKGIIGAVIAVLVFAALGSDDLDSSGHAGAAMMAVLAFVLGFMTWRESRHEATKARMLGIIVSTLAAFGLLGAIGGIESEPVPSDVVQPAPTPPNGAVATVAREAVTRDVTEPARGAPERPERAPARRAVAGQRADASGGLRDILYGVWQYPFETAADGGRLQGLATDEYFRNGTSTSVGRISFATRMADGTPFELTWQYTSSGEWSLDGSQLTEKLVDIKSVVTEVRINGQPVEVALVQQAMAQQGQSLPPLESLIPRGMSHASEIVAASPTEMTVRSTDNAGAVTTVVYRRVRTR